MVRLQVLGALGLTGDDGRDVRPVLAQPKRFALLVYLALAEPRGFRRRDLLLPLFWPEAPPEAARASLRRVLHFLRSHLGDDVIVSRGEEEVDVARDTLVCDALECEAHLAAGRDAEALALYHGDLLAGFFVTEAAPEMDDWIDATRRRYRDAAFAAAERLSDREAVAGRLTTARFWSQRALNLQPLSESALLRRLRLLDREGERAEALRVYEEFARRLEAELGVEPGPDARALVQGLRVRRPTPAMPPPAMPPAASPSPAPAPRSLRFPRWWPVAAVGAGALVFAAWALATRREPQTPVLAIGAIAPEGPRDSASLGATLPEILATGLGSIPHVQVISRARLYEVSGELGERELTPAALLRAAKQAGADRFIEGEIYPQPDGWRLDLRMVNLATGAVAQSYVLRARDPFALADSATARLAIALRRPVPAVGVADVSSTSLVARRYFDDGLRAYARRDFSTADALFGLAINEDPQFARALYYASRTRSELGSPRVEGVALARRAYDAALAHGTRYERLLIASWWAEVNQSPAGLPLADSLLAAFPFEPEAYILAAAEHSYAADFAGELRIYRQLAALDSQALTTGGPWCRACLALEGMSAAYGAMDSLEQALAALRRASRAQPRSKGAWLGEVYLLSQLGQDSASLALLEARADSVGATPGEVVAARAWLAARTGNWAEMDRAIVGLMAQSGEAHHGALWIKTIRDRHRGQLGAALIAARQYDRSGVPIPRAIVLFESGQFRASAALWDSLRLTYDVQDTTAGNNARNHVWMLTHEVTALAAAGDTARVALFADTLERIGRWSSYARDRRMYHYARGLMWDARRRPADAIPEYRAAITTLSYGYTRINYRLALDLLALGRAREAIPLLRAALHGGFESTNMYVTQTELHELLGRAFAALGERDSAAVHYRWVANAWRDGDPPFRTRARLAGERASALAR